MATKKSVNSMWLCLVVCVLLGSVCGTAFGESSSGVATITFGPEEFPLYTYITNQYADRGIIFGGDNPQILTDYANLTSPVLGAADPNTSEEFQGDIEGYFVSPHDGTTPMTVSWFSFDAGSFVAAETTLVEWFDSDNNKLGEVLNSKAGIERIDVNDISGVGIASWRIGIEDPDSAGYAIDNVDFDNPYLVKVTKTDDVNDDPDYPTCISPGTEIEYTICYENPTGQTFYNTYIVDYLPVGVDYDSIISENPLVFDFNYNGQDHSYVFPIGTIGPSDADCVTLRVTVNSLSDPLTPLHNVAELWDDDIRLGDDDEYTSVCVWDMGSIIHVDPNAPPGGNGTSWPLAYNDLQDALARVRLTNDPNIAFEVRAANGVYQPGDVWNSRFEIPDDTSVFGGYAGYGASDPDERDWKKYKTILTGSGINYTVVKMDNDSVLSGVIVEDAYSQGIDGSGVSSTVEHCVVKNNLGVGITCSNGDLTCRWSEICDNHSQGIFYTGSSYSLIVDHCDIHDNQAEGIRTEYSVSTITNSLIYQNGWEESYFYGIYLYNPSSSPTLRNCTIVYNYNEGLGIVGSNLPLIKNSILFFNNENENQLYGLTREQITYCCIPDPNDPNYVNPGTDPVTHNISYRPDFVYDYEPYGHYHIKYESPCRNAGSNTGVGQEEMDIDGQPRIADDGYSIVDIGADEVDCEDTWNENDWTYDGVINLDDFRIFSKAWLSEYPEDEFNSQCDLVEDNEIDLADLIAFCEDNPQLWLWEACWHGSFMEMYGMMSGGGEEMLMTEAVIPANVIPAQVGAGIQQVQEKSIEEQILDLEYAIEFLEQIWMEDEQVQQEIGPEKWQEFMDSVYQSLLYLQAENSSAKD